MVAGKFKNLYLDNDNVWFEEKRLGAKKTIKIPLDKVDSFEHGRYTLWILLILGILGAIIGIYLLLFIFFTYIISTNKQSITINTAP